MRILYLLTKLFIIKLQIDIKKFQLILTRINKYGFTMGLVKCNINPVQAALFIMLVIVFILGSLLRLVDTRLGATCYLTIIAIALPLEVMAIVEKNKKK